MTNFGRLFPEAFISHLWDIIRTPVEVFTKVAFKWVGS